MIKLQIMFGSTFLRGHLSILGKGWSLNPFLTRQTDDLLHLSFEEVIMKAQWARRNSSLGYIWPPGLSLATSGWKRCCQVNPLGGGGGTSRKKKKCFGSFKYSKINKTITASHPNNWLLQYKTQVAKQIPPFNLSWGMVSSGSSYSHLECPSLTSGSYGTKTQAQTCTDSWARSQAHTSRKTCPGLGACLAAHSLMKILKRKLEWDGPEWMEAMKISMIYDNRNNNMEVKKSMQPGVEYDTVT